MSFMADKGYQKESVFRKWKLWKMFEQARPKAKASEAMALGLTLLDYKKIIKKKIS